MTSFAMPWGMRTRPVQGRCRGHRIHAQNGLSDPHSLLQARRCSHWCVPEDRFRPFLVSRSGLEPRTTWSGDEGGQCAGAPSASQHTSCTTQGLERGHKPPSKWVSPDSASKLVKIPARRTRVALLCCGLNTFTMIVSSIIS